MKNYKTWLRVSTIFQFITGLIHSISLFRSPAPKNETEKQLFDLLSNYQFDFGAGMHRSMDKVILALSACFTLVYLLGGMINWFLIRAEADSSLIRGIVNINLIIFGLSFAIMVKFTFLPPIILTGLVFVFLIITRLTIKSKNEIG